MIMCKRNFNKNRRICFSKKKNVFIKYMEILEKS